MKHLLSLSLSLSLSLLHFYLSLLLQKRANPGLFFVYFRLSNNHYIQQIYVKKCLFSIWCWDSKPQPSGHESPPITTRPGLPLTYTYATQTQSAPLWYAMELFDTLIHPLSLPHPLKHTQFKGSGCGSVGRAVALIPEVCNSNPAIGKIL